MYIRDSIHRALNQMESVLEHARIKTMTQKRIDRFENKIPRHAEGCNVKVANVKCVEQPICCFIRLQSSIRMTDAHSVDIPTRFIVRVS